jgi:hypothetical protein
MRNWVALIVALGVGIQINHAVAGQRARPGQGPVTVNVTGPVILGFFPPYSESEEKEDGIIEGIAHVRFALEDIDRCFGDGAAIYRLDVTKSVTLRAGGRVERIRIPDDWAHSVGIILVRPGRRSRTVYATDGPSTLQWLGPQAAGEYFDAPRCSRKD